MQVEISLKKPIPKDLAEEVVKKSVYCSRHLLRLELGPQGNLVLITVEPKYADEVKGQVTRYLTAMLAGYRQVQRKIIFQTDVEPKFIENVWNELQRRSWAFSFGVGQIALQGPALALYRYFDHIFTDLGKREFSAAECQFPALIPSEILGRCRYFSSFPQSVTFVSHLTEDFDLLERFSKANCDGPLNFPEDNALQQPDHCLSPAVCYHCYRLLENQQVSADKPAVFTAVGTCFRYESRNLTSLERLWNFNMREIVFVGTQEIVLERRKRSIELVAAWLQRIGLQVRFETASDPFFTTDFSEKTFFQLMGDLKYEIQLSVASDRSIAAGSFNFHNDFFGKTFAIGCGSGTAYTGCTAFGLERWVHAFLCQKGFDLASWPDEIRFFVEESGS